MFPFLIVSWIVLFGILIAGAFSVDHVANVAKEGLRNSLSGIAKSFAIAVRDAGHEKITFETPDDDPLYERLLNLLSAWQTQIPVAVSIYTFRKNDEGEIVFIICPAADLNRDGIIYGEMEEMIPKGTIYEFESEDDIREIFDAFAGKSGFSNTPVADDWGLWITAAEPIFDETGERIDAVLGVDFRGEDWNTNIRRAVLWTEMFLLLSIILFFAVQIFTIRRQSIEDKLTKYAADLERTMDELVEAKKDADVAIQAKSFFLANISHEIRTPMAAILGCIDMLVSAQEGDSASLNHDQLLSQEQLVDIIQKSGKDLMAIIDDMLTYSSIDTNRLALESVPIDLRKLVEDVRIMANSHFEEKPQLQFRTEWEDSVPSIVIGDPARIRQILLTLISNAVKFTETGHVIVRCSGILVSEKSESDSKYMDESKYMGALYSVPAVTASAVATATPVPFLSPQIAHAKGLRGMTHVASAESAGLRTTAGLSQTLEAWRILPTALLLRIDVSDTGIGIAKEQFGTLFKPFTQVDDTSTRKFGGVGLGLSIVKGLVELMEGDIQVSSKPGQGSTFSVFLPVSGREDSVFQYKKQQPQPQPQIHSHQGLPPLQGYHILAVDDVVVNQIVVETQLRNLGAKVQSASNGKIAVDLTLEAERSELPFDFILMDLQMPVMDGFEATRILRQRGFNKPIVALSANRDSDKEALESGCNLALAKPADREMLLDTIVSLAPKNGEQHYERS